jgi:hypothetical protein
MLVAKPLALSFNLVEAEEEPMLLKYLDTAIKEAHHWAGLPNRGGRVYVYRLMSGDFYLSQETPYEINAEYIATVEPKSLLPHTSAPPLGNPAPK